ncbi:MAG: ribosomal protein S18-alanine N-acetyltransferase [Chloroflexi bacterium]|nr:ribosomal protein S18-alanine N-acetyltransferase [Chloroflexota bacterium]
MNDHSSRTSEDLSGPMKIRKMTLADLAQVVAIDQVSFSLPWPERSFHFELTENEASRCWVVESEGRVVAMLVGWFVIDDIHIATFATHPDFRRQGIGEKLLSHVLRTARGEGALTSFLEVREGNLAAQEMYRKFGYVVSGRREHYYNDNGEAAILMTLGSLADFDASIETKLPSETP